jgi:hypothetical protein
VILLFYFVVVSAFDGQKTGKIRQIPVILTLADPHLRFHAVICWAFQKHSRQNRSLDCNPRSSSSSAEVEKPLSWNLYGLQTLVRADLSQNHFASSPLFQMNQLIPGILRMFVKSTLILTFPLLQNVHESCSLVDCVDGRGNTKFAGKSPKEL